MRTTRCSNPHARLVRTANVVGVAVLLASLPAAALAQPNQAPRDPNALVTPQPAPPNKTPATWVGTLIALALAGIVLGASVIPSKRGHQD